MKSDDCSSGIHEYCSPCDCECHKPDKLYALLTTLTALETEMRAALSSPESSDRWNVSRWADKLAALRKEHQ